MWEINMKLICDKCGLETEEEYHLCKPRVIFNFDGFDVIVINGKEIDGNLFRKKLEELCQA